MRSRLPKFDQSLELNDALVMAYQTWLLLFRPMDECTKRHQTIAESDRTLLSPLPREFT